MPRLHFKFFFRTVLVIAFILMVLLAVKINLSNYEDLLNIVKPSVLWEGYESRISFENDLFTKERFKNLKVFSWLITISFFFAGFFFFQKSERMELFINYFFKTIRQKANSLVAPLKDISIFQKTILIIVAFIWVLFRIFYVELSAWEKVTFSSAQSFFDESLSYNYFVRQGYLATAAYYPDTNNHIFFNLISCFFNLFFNSSELTMRLPVFLTYVVLLVTIFLSVNKIFNFTTAIIALVLSGFLYSAGIYGLVGRGFMLMSFFSFVATVSVYKYSGSKDKFYLYVFILSSILGFYTVPVYLYPFVSLTAILFIQAVITKNLQEFYRISKVSFFVVAGVFVCYLPVLLISGVDALLSQNRWIQPMSLSSLIHLFPAYLAELSEYVLSSTRFRRGYMYAVLIALCFLFFALRHPQKKYRDWLWMVIAAGAVPLIVVVFMRVMAPYRAFTYYTYPLYIGIALVISTFIHQLKNKQVQKWVLCLVLAGIIIWGYSSYLIR